MNVSNINLGVDTDYAKVEISHS